MNRSQYLVGLACALALSTGPALSESIRVDAELVLAVDVSRSMSPHELDIQRRGYAEALVSDEVLDAIRDGHLGRVAIQYVEWAGIYTQRIVVDWTLIEGRDDAARFADRLLEQSGFPMSRTSISGGIDFAVNSIETNKFDGQRRIIDISGDGPNNQGPHVTLARDDALAKGIVINGLPLMTREGTYTRFDIDDLAGYYRDCVIGGPFSFLIPVHSWQEFPEAVRRKLVIELASRPQAIRINGSILDLQQSSTDCLIGEKIWERNQFMWQDP